MKVLKRIIFSLAAVGASALIVSAANPQGQSNGTAAHANPTFASVNFKTAVETSKVGKQEQANFEGMKKKMEGSLEDKEKVINEMSKQLGDPDFLDSLSPEAETDLKRKFRALSGEMSQLQNQYYQTLSQANFKIVQMITEVINQAAAEVAKVKNIDIVFNDEGTFYHSNSMDISKEVVAKMDELFDKQSQSSATPTSPLTP